MEEQVVYTVILDLTDNGCFNTGWRIKQHDGSKAILYVKITNNGEVAYDETNLPQIVFRRADGYSIVATMEAGPDDFYTYTIIGNETAVAGVVVMDVKFGSGETRSSTASCKFDVIPDTLTPDSDGSDVVNNNVLAITEEARTLIEEALITTARIADVDQLGVVKMPRDGSAYTDLDGTLHVVGGGGGTTNYNLLTNKPQINGETLVGDKTAEDLGLARNNIAVKDIPGLVAIDSETMNIDQYGNISPKVDISFSPTSTKPIANKTVFLELINKADNILASEKYNGLMSSSDKVKLDGIQENATATEINQKTVTLTASGWTDGHQIITDEDVTLDAMVFIDYGGVSGISCQQASGTLVFTTDEVPSDDVTLKVGIIK